MNPTGAFGAFNQQRTTIFETNSRWLRSAL